MQIAEIYSMDLDEARLIFGRSGNKVVKKYKKKLKLLNYNS